MGLMFGFIIAVAFISAILSSNFAVTVYLNDIALHTPPISYNFGITVNLRTIK